jgi:putative Holliday junction resolvase
VRPGVRIGVDVGSVRVGVAAADRDGLLATPVQTLARDLDAATDLRDLAELVRERAAVEVVVGLPRSLSGGEGPAARAARAYAERLAALVAPVPVRLVDERLSTVAAHQALRRSGVRERKGRQVVDQVAAVVILQQALDIERSSGRPPGEPVPAPDVEPGDRPE